MKGRGKPRSKAGPAEARSLSSHARELVRGLALRVEEQARSLLHGTSPSPFPGRGVEVVGVREYRPGDEVRSIDWRVTARRGRLHVKDFAGERDLPVTVVLDDPPSLRGGRSGVKDLRAREVAALLLALALQGGDRAGLMATGKVVGEDLALPGRGRGRLQLLLSALLEPPDSEGGPGGRDGSGTRGLVGTLERLAREGREGGRVFLVGGFHLSMGDLDALRRPLHRVCRRHGVTAVWIIDQKDARAPGRGSVLLRDSRRPDVLRALGPDDEDLAEALEEEEEEVESFLRERRVEIWPLEVGLPAVEGVRLLLGGRGRGPVGSVAVPAGGGAPPGVVGGGRRIR